MKRKLMRKTCGAVIATCAALSVLIPSAPSAVAAEEPVIDVLVLYTSNAQRDAGGVKELRDVVERSVDYTNEAFDNSEASAETRVAGVAPAPDFGRPADDNERVYDYLSATPKSVARLRDRHHADVIAIIAGNFGGMAYLSDRGRPLPPEAPGMEGASMVLGQQLIDKEPDTFAHELGHLLGLDHDRSVDPDRGDGYDHARGYVAPSKKWRTIMAYEDACQDAGTSCPVVPYFSNPNLDIDGEPLGKSVGQGRPGPRREHDQRIRLHRRRVPIARRDRGGCARPASGSRLRCRHPGAGKAPGRPGNKPGSAPNSRAHAVSCHQDTPSRPVPASGPSRRAGGRGFTVRTPCRRAAPDIGAPPLLFRYPWHRLRCH
ncbi:M12 family metallo-peptidase [Streptomyces sp. PmtG]